VVHSVHIVNVAIHAIAGGLGLATGVVPLLSLKGGPAHRTFGRMFVAFAGMALAAAFSLEALFSQAAWIYPATLAVTYQYFGGLRSLALKGKRPGVLDAMAALIALGAFAGLYQALGGPWSRAGSLNAPVAGALGWVALVAVYDLTRPLWALTWTTRLRPLDHGLKMTGAFFAMASAGGGNLFKGFQPWSQIGPLVLGFAVMALMAGLWAARRPISTGDWGDERGTRSGPGRSGALRSSRR